MHRMHGTLIQRLTCAAALAVFVAGLCQAADAAAPTFSVRYAAEAHAEPYSGRVYLFLAREGEPRRGPNWFRPGPMLAVDVNGLKPGEIVEIAVPSAEGPTPRPSSQGGEGEKGGRVLFFPSHLTPEGLRGFKAQAVMRFNPLEREVGSGPGNGYSDDVPVPADGKLELVVDKLVHAPKVVDSEWSKVFRVPSKLLSQFHGRPVELSAAVQLPPSYAVSPDRRYPVVYEVPGFGGTLRHGMKNSPYAPRTLNEVEFIHVMLDPNCPLGHHVFADSENNGPVGKALVEEFLPALDQAFRTTGNAKGRFLTGHSSGGWSSLWLQVTYPDVFNGTWSTAPDPVDFRDFQRINLYRAGENMYVTPEGERRPLGRVRRAPAIWYDDFSRMEEVLGPGGQLHSFEAVFSRRGKDGRPELLWDRTTGAIDPAVAESWKKYDIRRVLEENWPVLGPKLAGKLHVFMGDQDTFYLEGATRLLKESLEKLESGAVVEIHVGADHGSLMTPELRERIVRAMSERYLEE